MRGSVVALCYIRFKPDAPIEAVEVAKARLSRSADRLYENSALPGSWGSLASYQVADDAASLDTIAIPVAPAPQGHGSKLGPGEASGCSDELAGACCTYMPRVGGGGRGAAQSELTGQT